MVNAPEHVETPSGHAQATTEPECLTSASLSASTSTSTGRYLHFHYSKMEKLTAEDDVEIFSQHLREWQLLTVSQVQTGPSIWFL